MAFITSYAQLNKKYSLNFSDNNYGFSWDIFKQFVGDEWAEFFTTNCFYRFVPTARGTRKMEWQPFLGLFFGRHLFLIINWS
ncbi:hypothetical protein [Spiroplasma endosymbiont of Apeira syringaria]|uniref:hypothetical protein n=1 Tax=Spiroplasma endosymbiont of Apeira syringaria TaxID=3066307 RepID=UPI0030CD3863